jgi:hypothetical protein
LDSINQSSHHLNPIRSQIDSLGVKLGSQVNNVRVQLGTKLDTQEIKLDILLGFTQKVGETIERESALVEEQNKLSQDRKKLYEEFKNQFPA